MCCQLGKDCICVVSFVRPVYVEVLKERRGEERGKWC